MAVIIIGREVKSEEYWKGTLLSSHLNLRCEVFLLHAFAKDVGVRNSEEIVGRNRRDRDQTEVRPGPARCSMIELLKHMRKGIWFNNKGQFRCMNSSTSDLHSLSPLVGTPGGKHRQAQPSISLSCRLRQPA